MTRPVPAAHGRGDGRRGLDVHERQADLARQPCAAGARGDEHVEVELERCPLFDDGYVLLLRRDHPGLGPGGLTAAALAVSLSGNGSGGER